MTDLQKCLIVCMLLTFVLAVIFLVDFIDLKKGNGNNILIEKNNKKEKDKNNEQNHSDRNSD